VLRALLVVGLATGALAATASPATAPPDARAVAGLLRQQTAHFNAGRWRQLWATYTPRFHRACSYRLWLREQRAMKAFVGGRVAVRAVRVRLTSRSRARVSYVMLLGRQGYAVVQPPRDDLYVKIRGRWRDEGDQITTCRAGSV
jgi:hypothetical protein